MRILSSVTELRAWRAQQGEVALVPTMGNLHAGHLHLVEQAKVRAECVVVSIFVNPMQFGAHEDLDRYPRTFREDCEQLERLGTDAVFAPAVDEIYPRGLAEQTAITVPHISDILCGASRPGHFTGVATVVCKLFNMVQPTLACFGEKDYQQLQVIKLMTQDLALPVEVVGIPTVRATDGLALSSRNGYLNSTEREQAPAIYAAIQAAAHAVQQGQAVADVEAQLAQLLEQAQLRVDYVAIRRQLDLAEPQQDDHQLVVLVAAYAGTTRLIDNLQFQR